MFRHADHSPQTLVGISFDDLFRAREFLLAASRLASRSRLVLKDAVTVVKDHDGKTVVHESVDPQPGRSALSGAVWVGLIGVVLGGPVGLAAGSALGAGVGTVSAHVIDLGISDAWVAWFRDAVRTDTATLLLLVTELDRDALVDEASRFPGAQLVYANLDPLMIDRMKQAFGDTTPSLVTEDDTETDRDVRP